MNEDVSMTLDLAKDSMITSYTRLESELTKIRAGKATPSMVDRVQVDYYGSQTLLNQVSNISTLDARTLTIQPWEKAMLEPIETAITNSNLGLNPQNNGEMIIINVPALTEERRTQLVKQAKAEGESCKVSIRSVRKEANDAVKDLLNDGLGEDAAKDAEGKVQDLTNSYTNKIDNLVAAKEKDIMTV